jgi:endonuclease/exonuclease/phosphatase (EEP) superfamily protein YafD
MRPLPIAIIERLAAGSLRVWLIVGILLRITRLRDGWRPLAFVFYTTPWPAIAAGMLVLALHAWRLGHVHRRHRYVILTAGALFTWFATSWYSPSDETAAPTGPPLRVIAWNTGHPNHRLAGAMSWLQGQEADIIAIAESQPKDVSLLHRWEENFPGYQIVTVRGEMICLARGELSLLEQGKLGSSSYYGLYRARVRRQEYTVLQADISTREPRLPPLRRLAEIARQRAQEKLLIVGDLNTPRESAAFDPLRPFMDHAFERAGTGLAETWPSMAPALSLDHVWSSQSLPPRRCTIGWTIWSDHRPVVADFGRGEP